MYLELSILESYVPVISILRVLLEYRCMIHLTLVSMLKLGNGIQFQLNAKGSTPSEVLVSEYKSVLKPALTSFIDDIKRSSVGKYEELTSLRQQPSESASKLEVKQNHNAVIQSHIDEVESQLNPLRNETYENASSCAAEARKLAEEGNLEDQKMSLVEKEADEFMKATYHIICISKHSLMYLHFFLGFPAEDNLYQLLLRNLTWFDEDIQAELQEAILHMEEQVRTTRSS